MTLTMTTQTQNLVTIPLTQMRLMTTQAKHPYTALEAKHQFTKNTTDQPPEILPDEEELDNMDDEQLPEPETQVPTLCQFERVSVPPSDYIP